MSMGNLPRGLTASVVRIPLPSAPWQRPRPWETRRRSSLFAHITLTNRGARFSASRSSVRSIWPAESTPHSIRFWFCSARKRNGSRTAGVLHAGGK